jgi:hypothetical protein
VSRRRHLAPACALAAVATLAGCTVRHQHSEPDAVATPAGSAAPCHAEVAEGPAPDWVADHFSPGARPRHSIGRRGEIAAVLFGYPYHSPPVKDRNNKILWIARDAPTVPASDAELRVTARLEGEGRAVTRTVDGGPGPSTIDLPEAGCWRLTLTWPGHRDSLDLVYEP